MKSYFGQRRSGVIFAADLPTYSDNARIIEQISDEIDVIKINTPLVFGEGPKVISRLVADFKKPVFADLKVADVPHTNAKVVEMVRDHGGAAVMVHGFVGPDGLSKCVEVSREEVGIIVQLELTNPGGKVFTAPIANDMARLASTLGIFGTQAPGNRPARIKEIRGIIGPEPVIVCCGVGAQGGLHSEVEAAGGTYSIIGRAIYEASDPKAALRSIVSTPAGSTVNQPADSAS